MVELYLKKIIEDGWVVEQVPKLWREQVKKELNNYEK